MAGGHVNCAPRRLAGTRSGDWRAIQSEGQGRHFTQARRLAACAFVQCLAARCHTGGGLCSYIGSIMYGKGCTPEGKAHTMLSSTKRQEMHT